MPSKHKAKALWPVWLLLTATLAACQSTPQVMSSALIEQTAEPEPQPVSLQTEFAIARISELLSHPQLPDKDRARLFYERGLLYDSTGLLGLARLDFSRALKLAPTMADAHNFLGIYFTLNGDFDQAYDAFDAALELEPDYQYGYMNRGIALLYGDRPELSVQDFSKFQALEPTDPYRALWRFFAEYQQSPDQAKALLSQQQASLDPTKLGTHVVAFYLGQLTEAELIAKASAADVGQQQLTEQLCEAYFYLAKWHQLQQQPSQAVHYFKLVLATQVYEFVEYRYARLELERTRQQVVVDEHEAH